MEINSKVSMNDLAVVLAQSNALGRFFTQLGMAIDGKGWVSPDLLKGLDAKSLMEVKKACEASVQKADLNEKSAGEVGIDADAPESVDLTGSKPKVLHTDEQKYQLRQVHKLGKVVLGEVTKRDRAAFKTLSILSTVPLSDLISNPKLAPFFESYLQEATDQTSTLHGNYPKVKEGINALGLKHPQNQILSEVIQKVKALPIDQQLKVRDGFIEFLAEGKTEGRFSLLDTIDFGIGWNQLKGSKKQLHVWKSRLERVLSVVVEPYRGQEAAVKLFAENPDLKKEYESFKEKIFDKKDNELGLRCKGDYAVLLEKRKTALDDANGALKQLEVKKKDFSKDQYNFMHSEAEKKVKDAVIEFEKIQAISDKLPEKRSDHVNSYSKFTFNDEYPFYNFFIDSLVESRITGTLDPTSASGKFIQGLTKDVKRGAGRLLQFDDFKMDYMRNAYVRIKKISVTENKVQQYEYIAALVEDKQFAEAAADFLNRIGQDDCKNEGEFLQRFETNFVNLKNYFDEKIKRERGVEPPDIYNQDFASALYLAAGLHLNSGQIQAYKDRMAIIEKTVTGKTQASSFYTKFETGINWIEAVAENKLRVEGK